MPDVSRETAAVPPPPEAALRLFEPTVLPAIRRYAELLGTEGVLRGLIGPREVPRLWDRHLLNCMLLAPLLPEGASVVDLGSGAGLPGLVVALARPDLSVTLVEPLLRRTTFLDEMVALLEPGNVEVVRARAEQLPPGRRFDVVTARALAPLPRLLGWALPLVTARGCVLAMKGSSARAEVEAAREELRSWSAEAEVIDLVADGTSPTTVVRVAGAGGAALGWQPAAAVPRRQTRRGPR
jgi:16S rRNA (guanine527-N7)-methyltransferase